MLALLAALWALATPVGAAPDEPAHLIKAASVVRGQLIGARGPDGQTTVQVPEYIAFTQSQTCYAFNADKTADCTPPTPKDSDRTATAVTTAGLYNPVYYALVGWPSLIDGNASGIYWMRIVSGMVVALFLALAFALLIGWRRPAIPLVGFATALTPMVLFLGGTVNPNTLEIAATLTAFTALLTIIREPNPSRIAGRSAILLVSFAIVANMRGLSLLWLLFAILTPLLLISRERLVQLLKTRAIQVAIGGAAIAAIAALVWLIASNSLGASVTDPNVQNTAPGVGTSGISGFVSTLIATFDYGQQVIGILGWLDTPLPSSVYFLWAALVGGIMLVAFALLRRRALLVTLILTGAVVLLPPILQGIYINKGGIIWQGRYILPLFVCLIVAAAAFLSDRIALSRATHRRLLVLLLIAWAGAEFLSFATALRRYAIGIDTGWRQLLNPHWAPPGGTLPLLATFALLLVVAILGALSVSRPRDRPYRPETRVLSRTVD